MTESSRRATNMVIGVCVYTRYPIFIIIWCNSHCVKALSTEKGLFTVRLFRKRQSVI